MSSTIFDPQAILRDIEAQLAQFETWISVTSACALTLTLSAYALLSGLHL